MNDYGFAFGGETQRGFGYPLPLLDRLQQALAGLAVHIQTVDAGGVEALEQPFEGRRREVPVFIERCDNGGQNPMEV
jgi:hypothetical protein